MYQHFSNPDLQQYIWQVFLVHSQKNTLFQINTHSVMLACTRQRTQKMHAGHRHVMRALQQGQVPQQGQEWQTNSDDVCLATKQG